MLPSVVDAVFGRLPVEPSVLSTFFDSALAFLFGFLMIYLFARYILKPVAGWLLKYREIVVEPAVRQLVLQLIDVTGAAIGIWVGLHFAGAAEASPGPRRSSPRGRSRSVSPRGTSSRTSPTGCS